MQELSVIKVLRVMKFVGVTKLKSSNLPLEVPPLAVSLLPVMQIMPWPSVWKLILLGCIC
jgi:hypothetical protein